MDWFRVFESFAEETCRAWLFAAAACCLVALSGGCGYPPAEPEIADRIGCDYDDIVLVDFEMPLGIWAWSEWTVRCECQVYVCEGTWSEGDGLVCQSEEELREARLPR